MNVTQRIVLMVGVLALFVALLYIPYRAVLHENKTWSTWTPGYGMNKPEYHEGATLNPHVYNEWVEFHYAFIPPAREQGAFFGSTIATLSRERDWDLFFTIIAAIVVATACLIIVFKSKQRAVS